MATYTITEPCMSNQVESTIATIAHVQSEAEGGRGGGIKFEETIQGDQPQEYTNISLEDDETRESGKKRVPRRILHFSDGILEEYSTDEENEEEVKIAPVDPKTLDWLPWIWFYFVAIAFGMLGVADYFGEKLAWFFGITTPKYQYAIDEYNRMQAEEEEEREREKREEAAARARYLQTTSPKMMGAMSIEMTEITGMTEKDASQQPKALQGHDVLSSIENTRIPDSSANSLQKY